MLSALREYLDPDVRRNELSDQKFTDKIKFYTRCRREPHLDLLKPELHKEFKEFELSLNRHGIGQCLITVTQVNAAPDRSLCEPSARP